jgi:hypothetical protein
MSDVPPMETYSPAAFLCFASCEFKKSPPGKVFWIKLRENQFFTIQEHKADTPLIGSIIHRVRGAWTQNNAPYRILTNSDDDIPNYEIAINDVCIM